MKVNYGFVNTLGVGIFLLVILHYNGVSSSGHGSPVQCQPGWTGGYGKCYKYFSGQVTWYHARKYCRNYGAGLVAIGKDFAVKAAFIKEVALAADPDVDTWWQGASLDADVAVPTTVKVDTGQYVNYKVGFLDNLEIEPHAQPYDRCQAMIANEYSYLYPLVYGSILKPCIMKLPFVCEAECCAKDDIMCITGGCVPGDRVCDGKDDCGDGTDERNCPTHDSWVYTDPSKTFGVTTYGNYETKQWFIEGEPGQQVSLEVTFINTETNKDIVTLWCGGRSLKNSVHLHKTSGQRKVAAACQSPFAAVTFNSDFDNPGSVAGFTVNYALEYIPTAPVNLDATETEQTVLMDFPGGITRYYLIDSGNQWLLITLKRVALNLPENAHVFVFDGETPEDTLLYEFNQENQNDISGDIIQSTSRYLLLFASTDFGTSTDTAEFTFYSGCDVVRTALHTVLKSPGHNVVNYPDAQECTYNILSGTDDFFEVIVDTGSFYPGDYVEVFAGDDLLFDSQTDLVPFSVDTSSDNVTVYFKTSGGGSSTGFSMRVSIGCEDPEFNSENILYPLNPSFGLDDTIVVSCPPGFYLAQELFAHIGNGAGPVTMTCGNGVWDIAQTPNCVRRRCGFAPMVENGYIRNDVPTNGYYFEDEINYACNAGFGFQTNVDSVICQANGEWSLAIPVCGSGQCGPLGGPTIPNGNKQLVNGDGTGRGSVYRYSCDPEYIIDGDPFRICTSGLWTLSPIEPVCVKKRCELRPIANALWQGPDSIEVDDSTNVICEPGYMVVGSPTMTCLADRNFDQTPVCEDIDECAVANGCGEPDTCLNTVGSYTCSCSEGYELNVDGRTCSNINECAPDNIGPCDYSCQDTTGSYICSCNTGGGYVLYTENNQEGVVPPDDSTKENATYRYDHTCVLRQCPFDHANAPPGTQVLTFEAVYRVGSVIDILCEEGYVPTARFSSTCGITGLWSPPLGSCQPATCTIPSTFDDTQPDYSEGGAVKLPGTTVAFGSVVTLTCPINLLAGRPSEQISTRECAFDRDSNSYKLGSGDAARCTRVICDPPWDAANQLGIGNGILVYDPAESGNIPAGYALSAFQITCNPGAEFGGSTLPNEDSNIAFCGNDGQWVFYTGFCSTAQCEDPPDVVGATTLLVGNSELQSTATYACTGNNYILSSNPSGFTQFTCQLDNQDIPVWSPDPLTIDLQCIDNEGPSLISCPPDMEHPLHEVLLQSDIPQAAFSDNSGYFEVTTSFSPPFVIGSPLDSQVLTVQYIATDLSGQTSTPCSFQIIAEDLVPPDLICPLSFSIELNNEDEVIVADLPQIAAFDFTLDASDTIVFGPDTFIPDLDAAPYVETSAVTATDTNGRISQCSFSILIFASCGLHEPPPPVDGDISCTGNTCTLSCTGDTYFRYEDINSNFIITQTLFYICVAGEWLPSNSNILPDGYTPVCLSTSATSVQVSRTMFYNLTDPPLDPDCLPGYETAIISDSFLVDTCPSISIQLLQQTVVATDIGNQQVQIDVTLELSKPNPNAPDSFYDLCAATIYETIESAITNDFDPFDVEVIVPNPSQFPGCSALEIFSQTVQTDPPYLLGCSAAEEIIDFDCVPCGPGYYIDDNDCIPCEKGTYSTTPGSIGCISCLAGFTTATERSVSSNQCQPLCSNVASFPTGYSSNGVSPCNQCPLNTYVSLDGLGTSCDNCLPDTFTLYPGATLSSDCIPSCLEGSFSPNGLNGPTACQPCPRGTYQSARKQLSCNRCNEGTTTDTVGATSSSQCVSPIVDPTICTLDCGAQGTCDISGGNEYCVCNADYTGPLCASVINYCQPNPCVESRGSCTIDLTEPNGYKCSCIEGFDGTNCEVNELCLTDPCGANGACVADGLSYICNCNSGYAGPTCNQADDPCTTNPCLNNGQCVSIETVRRTCTCQPGFTGHDCQTNIDDCASKPCRNGGTCFDGDNTYSCQCLTSDGYSGLNCENHGFKCQSNTCNGGVCITNIATGPETCRCSGTLEPAIPVSGLDQISTGSCTYTPPCSQPSFTCENGFCVNPIAPLPATCSCQDGFEGLTCQINTDDCDTDPCVHGECYDLINDYSCYCYPGWTGTNCDVDINECDTLCNPSTQVGVQNCNNDDGTYDCFCNPGYTGTNCDLDIDECESNPCFHGGTCTQPAVDYFSCECADGWIGTTCEEVEGFCVTNPCQNNAPCIPTFNSMFCDCPLGTRGNVCDGRADVCIDVSPVCSRGGQCSAKNDTYAECECDDSSIGQFCELQRDWCNPDNNICANGGMCKTNKLDEYECVCKDGFSGETCEETQERCDNIQCVNGGSCINTPRDPHCACAEGYDGPFCDKLINRNYDINLDATAYAVQQFPFGLHSSSFSVGTWVQYTVDPCKEKPTGAFLNFYSSRLPYNDVSSPYEDKSLWLSFRENRVMSYLSGTPTALHYDKPNGEMYNIDTGDWFYVQAVYDSDLQKLKIYANNVLVAKELGVIVPYTEYAWVTVGAGQDDHGNTFGGFTGSVTQVQAWNLALTEEQNVLLTGSVPNGSPVPVVGVGLVMDYTNWDYYPGTWPTSPSQITLGKQDPEDPGQCMPRFLNCPDKPISKLGVERRTVITWPEFEVENSVTGVNCIYHSGDAFTWGLYTNICIIENEYGFKAKCTFHIAVRKLECPDPIIVTGVLPPNCEVVDGLTGDVRVCTPECPAQEYLSVAQPLSYMCDGLGSFNVQNQCHPGTIPSCGVESPKGVLYDVHMSACYPDVTICEDISRIGGIQEEIRVHLKTLNDGTEAQKDHGAIYQMPLCQADDCSDVIMSVRCPGTCIDIEIKKAFSSLRYDGKEYATAKELLQAQFIDNDYFTAQWITNGNPDPLSFVFDDTPSCEEGAGYLKEKCVICGKGQYSPGDGKPCRLCPKGTYQDQTKQTECIECSSVSPTTESAGATSESECIWKCEKGYYFNLDHRKCKPCPVGFYMDEEGSSRCCKQCAATKTTDDEASTSPDDCIDTCPSGQELYSGNCRYCPQGYYRQQGVHDDCVACPLGSTTIHVPAETEEDCSYPDCAPGTYINGTVCKPCPIGSYQPDPSQTTCFECGEHQLTENVGSVDVSQCYDACPQGLELVDGKCKPCPIGEYKDNSLPDRECEECPHGWITQSTGATSVALCLVDACSPGEHLVENACERCPEDTYQPEEWQNYCIDCPENTGTGGLEGSVSEDDCRRSCAAGMDEQGGICRPCEMGTWKPVAGTAACTPCPDGYTTSGTGATSVDRCDREICLPGEFQTSDLRCDDCPRGTYQPGHQSIECIDCPGALTTIGTGNSELADCIPNCASGYQWDASYGQCVHCPQGTFRTKDQEDVCQPCPNGLTTPTAGSTSVAQCTQTACGPGHFIKVVENVCEECPKGRYQDEHNKPACKPCPLGTYTAHPASTSEDECKRACSAGYETSENFQCTPCEQGYFKSGADLSDCMKCPEGSTTAGVGATSINDCYLGDCQPGTYQSNGQCKPCPHGTYQPLKWQTSCIPCGNFFTTPHEGSTSPTDCTEKTNCTDQCLPYTSGGVCEYTSGGYHCVCRPGWVGQHPACISPCSPHYCSYNQDCVIGTDGKPTCRCRPGYADCVDIEPSLNLPLIIGASVGGGLVLLLLICLGFVWCGCCGCRNSGSYHRHRGSPAPSLHSVGKGDPLEIAFQHPAMRQSFHPGAEVYNPTSSNPVIAIQTGPDTGMTYGYHNSNSAFLFHEDKATVPTVTATNGVYHPPHQTNVATLDFFD